MKLQRNIAIILAAAFVLLPALAGAAAAADSSTETLQRVVLFQSPEMSNHYGYITVDSVDVELNGVNAIYTVNYSIDPWIAFLVFLLGKQDLKNRLLKIINPPAPSNGQTQEIVFQYVDNDQAIISVSNAAMSYGDNTYWYPEQEFAITIPQITFTASFIKTYNNTRVIERGFSYY
ncbi:MAG TPA: hypothetical protein O0X65_01850 [Methanocorpusculum sp.]|nr:hypothetical protein [Methanocorpusculum sp.]